MDSESNNELESGDSKSQPNSQAVASTNRRTLWLQLFRVAVVVVVVIALFYTVRSSTQQLRNLEFGIDNLKLWMLALAIVCYIAAMFLSAAFWKSVLNSLGCHPDWSKTLKAFFVSQLGKYVPGKAAVVVIRTDMIRDAQTDTAAAAASVIVETLTWIFVGSVIASVLLVFQFNDRPALRWTALVLAAATGLATCPPVFNWLTGKFLRRPESNPFAGLRLSTLLKGWFLMSIGWCLNGVSLWLVINSFTESNVTFSDLSLSLACVSLATVAGFASLLPGGLGVRELVMIPLLTPRFGAATAIIAAILIRLVWLSAELLCSVIIYLVNNIQNPTQPSVR